MDVGTLIRGHQRLAKESGAEVRDDDWHATESAAPAPRPPADRPAAGRTATAIRASSARRPTARRSARTPRHRASAAVSNTLPTASSSSRYRCIAGKSATARKRCWPSACARRGCASGASGLNMTKPTNRTGWRADGGRHRGFVAGDAGNEGGARHAVAVELGNPAIREQPPGCREASQPSRAATAPARSSAGRSATSLVRISRKREEKKWQWLSQSRDTRSDCRDSIRSSADGLSRWPRRSRRTRRQGLLRSSSLRDLRDDSSAATRELVAHPVTVRMYCGCRGLGSIFCRSQATWTSTVRVDGIEL